MCVLYFDDVRGLGIHRALSQMENVPSWYILYRFSLVFQKIQPILLLPW